MPSIAPALLSSALSLFVGPTSAAPGQPPGEEEIEEVLGLEESEIAFLELPKSLDGLDAFTVEVPIEGEPRPLALNVRSLRGPEYRLLEDAGEGFYVEHAPGPVRTLRGELLDEKGCTAAGSLQADGLWGTLRMADGRQYWIEPLAGHLDDAEEGLHVVYQQEHLNPFPMGCGTPDGAFGSSGAGPAPTPGPELGSSALGLGSSGGGWGVEWHVADLACDADFEFYQLWGSSVASAADRIELMTACLNVQYERQVRITHRISALVVRSTSSDPYTEPGAFEGIDEVRDHWRSSAAPKVPWDLVQMHSGKFPIPSEDGSGFVAGAAVGTVCGEGGNMVHAWSRNLALPFIVNILAHELGHNWDADHCCSGLDPFTMNPSGDVPANRFNSASIISIVQERHGAGCVWNTVPNDDCENAFVIGNGTHHFPNSGSARDGTSQCGGGSDVWFSYTPTATGPVVIDTLGSNYDTVLSVHTSCPGTPANEIACNDDDPNQAGKHSWVSFSAGQDKTYYIRLGGYLGLVGDAQLNVQGPPAAEPLESVCQQAKLLCPGEYFGNTELAVRDGSSSADPTGASPSVWYRYRPQQSGLLHLDTNGTSFESAISLHGGCPGTASNEWQVAVGPPGIGAALSRQVTAHADYLIRVSGTGAAEKGPFRLGIMGPSCDYNACQWPRLVDQGTHTMDFVGTTSHLVVGTCDSVLSPSRDLYFQYVAPHSGTLMVSTCGTHDWPNVDAGLDTRVTLHSGCPATTVNEIGCSDDAASSGSTSCGPLDAGDDRDSLVTLPVVSDQEVLVRVSPVEIGRVGPAVMQIGMLPENDDCADATPILTGFHQGSTLFSTIDGSSICANSDASGDVWYRFDTEGCPGTLRVDTCGTYWAHGVSTALGVYGGCPGLSSSAIACSSDALTLGCLHGSEDAALEVDLGPLQSVYIRVTNGPVGGRFLQGAFDLNVAFDAPQPGPIQNPDFSNGNGYGWCFQDDSLTGLVQFQNLAAYVRGGAGPSAFGLETRTWIEQEIAIPSGGVSMNFAWSFAATSSPGVDGAFYDVIDLATGQSVFGGRRTLSQTPIAGYWQAAWNGWTGSGSYLLQFGVFTPAGGMAGAPSAWFDTIVLNY